MNKAGAAELRKATGLVKLLVDEPLRVADSRTSSICTSPGLEIVLISFTSRFTVLNFAAKMRRRLHYAPILERNEVVPNRCDKNHWPLCGGLHDCSDYS